MASPTQSRPRMYNFVAFFILLLCSGCTSVSDDGTTATYGYAAWVPLSVALVGLATVGWGYLSLFRDSEDESGNQTMKGGMTMVGGAVVILFVAPAYLMASVKVGTDKTVIGGSMLWFVPSSTVVDYGRVSDIRTEVSERWTRRGKRKTETLVIAFTDGKTERLSQSALVNAALPRIISALSNRQQGGNPAMIAAMQQMPAAPPMGNLTPANPMTPAQLGHGAAIGSTPTTPDPTLAGANNQVSPPGQPVSAATPLVAGMAISGQAKDGVWYDSHVTEVLADGSVKIHYEGYPDAFDEVVPRTRLRVTDSVTTVPMTTLVTTSIPMPTAQPAVAVAAPIPSAAPGIPPTAQGESAALPAITYPANTIEATASNVKQGQTARAFWGATWYNVKILQVLPDKQAKIHYEGYADSFDEVVPFSKLRLSK